MDSLLDGAPYQSALRYKETDRAVASAEKHREALLAAYDAQVAGDYGPFWSLFDPDAVFHVAACLPYGGAHHGIEATRKALAVAHSCYERMRVEIEQVLAAGDIVTSYIHINILAKKSGRTASLPMIEMYRFRNDKIIEWRALHFDVDYLARTIAGTP